MTSPVPTPRTVGSPAPSGWRRPAALARRWGGWLVAVVVVVLSSLLLWQLVLADGGSGGDDVWLGCPQQSDGTTASATTIGEPAVP